MKKIVITFVFMFISMIAMSQTVISSSNWYDFKRGAFDAARISFVIDSNNKAQLYVAYTNMTDWPDISYNNDIIVEYTDGTAEKTQVNKIDNDITHIMGRALYVSGIIFDIYGPNFDKKTISVIHFTNDRGGWLDVTPGKKWVKNERKYKDNMMRESFSRLAAKKEVMDKIVNK